MDAWIRSTATRLRVDERPPTTPRFGWVVVVVAVAILVVALVSGLELVQSLVLGAP